MNIKFKIIFVAILSFIAMEGLSAQLVPVLTSGYSGFLWRIQTGGGYTELVQEFEEEKKKTYATGYLLGTQVGWAFGGSWALHFNYSHFLSGIGSTKGQELAERTDMDLIGKTNHSLNLWSAGFGFTWFHVPSAFYISPEFRLIQNGNYKATQRNSSPNEFRAEFLENTETTYFNSKNGLGITMGKDQWINRHFAMGFALTCYYDVYQMQRTAVRVNSGPEKEERSSIDIDLNKGKATSLMYGFNISMLVN